MIRVKRGQLDANRRRVSPGSEWFKRARLARDRVVRDFGKRTISFDRSIYAAPSVRAALSRLFHGKCGYCEFRLVRMDWDVDHYRPKARVHEVPTHPGYYWLSYKWSNLLPACTYCNRNRKEPPQWQVAREMQATGKSDHFPLADERTRAFAPTDNIELEEPLLLNPTLEEPSRHLTFDPFGIPIGKSKKGDTSIAVYHLNSTSLNTERKRVIDKVTKLLRARASIKCQPVSLERQTVLDELNALISDESADSAPYAAAARAVIRDPGLFGV